MNQPMQVKETPIENSPYRIVERNGTRYLKLKSQEGPTFSAMRLDEPAAIFRPYARTMLQWLPLVPQPEDVLLIGLGGGDFIRSLRRGLPQTRLVAVEIDAVIVDIARQHFGIGADDDRLSVFVTDGAAHVREHPNSCDVLLIDVCDSELDYPESMASEAFFASCHDAVRGNGPIMVNLFLRDEAWRNVYCQALRKSFPSMVMCGLSETQHVIMAFKQPPDLDWALLSQRAQQLEPMFGVGLPAYWKQFEAMLSSTDRTEPL
jgi:spermidine synthase